jgi:hypothetical protein
MYYFTILAIEKSIVKRGRQTQQILHVRKAHNNCSFLPKFYARFVSSLEGQDECGLGSANGFPPAFLHRMDGETGKKPNTV